MADAADLASAVRDARLMYCVFTVDKYYQPPRRGIQSIARFPESGWLEGSVDELAGLARLVAAPQRAVDQAADALQSGINEVATVLEELENSRSAINVAIARLLGMTNVTQTRRMAGAILANAMVFHDRIAGIHGKIKPLNLVCGPDVSNPQGETLAAWAEILKIEGRHLLSRQCRYRLSLCGLGQSQAETRRRFGFGASPVCGCRFVLARLSKDGGNGLHGCKRIEHSC